MEKVRFRDWIFTIFAKNDEKMKIDGYLKFLEKKCMKDKKQTIMYLIVGIETCPDTKKKHLQGYISLKNDKSRSAFQKWTNPFKIKHYCDFRKGSPAQARNYCWKGENKKSTLKPSPTAVYFEHGELPVGQGKRNDIEKTKEALKNGANLRSVISMATSNQSIQYAQKYLTYFEEKRKWKPQVQWFWGPTGTGKTHDAWKELGYENTYVCNETNKWWDGYDAHENVIIDDFREGFCRFSVLLRLLDKYPMRVEVKGAFRQFLAKKIIITSPYKPQDCYCNNQEQIQQLIRRIDIIKEYTEVKLHKG